MKIFINIKKDAEIKKFTELGVLDGVNTEPYKGTILLIEYILLDKEQKI